MDTLNGIQGWEQINESQRPEYYVQTLATITGMEFAKAYKQRSFELLGLHEGDAVLDVGCGLGDDVFAMAELVGPNGLAAGIDLSQEMVNRAQEKALALDTRQVKFCQGKALALPFESNTFHGCRADRVLQHLSQRSLAIAEMVRVLKPGGRLVTIDPDWETMVFDLPDKALTRKICAAVCDRVTNGWTGHQSPRLFAEAGLEHIAVLPITAVLTDLQQARTILELDRALVELTSNGSLGAEEVARWNNLLEESSQIQRFFTAMSGFMVIGNKSLASG